MTNREYWHSVTLLGFMLLLGQTSCFPCGDGHAAIRVKGEVQDQDTGQPLTMATIRLELYQDGNPVESDESFPNLNAREESLENESGAAGEFEIHFLSRTTGNCDTMPIVFPDFNELRITITRDGCATDFTLERGPDFTDTDGFVEIINPLQVPPCEESNTNDNASPSPGCSDEELQERNLLGTFYLPDSSDGPRNLTIHDDCTFDLLWHICDSYGGYFGDVSIVEGQVLLSSEDGSLCFLDTISEPDCSCTEELRVQRSEGAIQVEFACGDRIATTMWPEGRSCAILGEDLLCAGIKECECNDHQYEVEGVPSC